MSRSRQLQHLGYTVLYSRPFCSTTLCAFSSSSSSFTPPNGDQSIYKGLFGELKRTDGKDSVHNLHDDKNIQIRKEKYQKHSFIDSVRIEVNGGKGGEGSITFETLGPNRKRPAGGNGGRGGNVYIMGDEGAYSLDFQTFHFNGGNGGKIIEA